MDILGEVVQPLFEVGYDIDLPFLQGMKHGHQNPPRARAGI